MLARFCSGQAPLTMILVKRLWVGKAILWEEAWVCHDWSPLDSHTSQRKLKGKQTRVEIDVHKIFKGAWVLKILPDSIFLSVSQLGFSKVGLLAFDYYGKNNIAFSSFQLSCKPGREMAFSEKGQTLSRELWAGPVVCGYKDPVLRSACVPQEARELCTTAWAGHHPTPNPSFSVGQNESVSEQALKTVSNGTLHPEEMRKVDRLSTADWCHVHLRNGERGAGRRQTHVLPLISRKVASLGGRRSARLPRPRPCEVW